MLFAVFLDVDGVLNTKTTCQHTPDGCTGIDDARVKILANAIKMYDCYEALQEVFMAIRALYEIKDAPLALIVDMYKNAIVPSIAEKSREGYMELRESLAYDYFATDTSDKCDFVDWMELNNNLKFSKRYMKIFRHPLEGMWVAYEALSFVFEFMKDGKAANVQIFSYNGKSFWIGIVNETVIFITPEENEGRRRPDGRV